MPPKSLKNRTLADPNAWTPTHTAIILAHSEGKPTRSIATEVGLPIHVVKTVVESPLGQKNLEAVRSKVVETVVSQRLEMMGTTTLRRAREMLQEASNMAVTEIVLMANGQKEGSRIQLEACKDILDRCGVKALVITETRERVYSPEEVTSAKKVLVEAQDIVARLSNERSPFILGDTGK